MANEAWIILHWVCLREAFALLAAGSPPKIGALVGTQTEMAPTASSIDEHTKKVPSRSL